MTLDEHGQPSLNEYPHEYRDDEKYSNFTMVVNAKKQNKIGWSKEYNAKIAGDCIVLSRRPKRNNAPTENIVVDLTQSAIIYDDKKLRIHFASSTQIKYITATNQYNYWLLKETILQILSSVRHSRDGNMSYENAQWNANNMAGKVDISDRNIEEDEQHKQRADGRIPHVMLSELSSECLRRNLELCKMGFALSRQCHSDDNEINSEKYVDDLSTSHSGNTSSDVRIVCEHKNEVSNCECHKLYGESVGLFKAANDLLEEVKNREGNINVAYEQIMVHFTCLFYKGQ
uniref:Uncharacterized protein n=1 Tax=Parascaris univalens TaxID=6257 RepID=A0A915B4W8_PARUN